MRTHPRSLTLAVGLTLALTSNAAAQGNWTIDNIPDLDQRRLTLPGNGGMYCVPTASMNLWAYYANNGYPQPSMLDGPRDWKSQTEYTRVTDAIFALGVYMGTDASEGTKGGAEFGAQLWSISFANGDICVYGNSLFSDGAMPSVSTFNAAYLLGMTCEAVYGTYETSNGGKRVGGHAVTVKGVLNNAPPVDSVLLFRDPAYDTPANSSQSDFRTSMVVMHQTAGIFTNKKGTVSVIATLPRMDVTGPAKQFIDQFLMYYPASAFLLPPGLDSNEFRVVRPKRPTDSQLPEVQTFSKAPGTGPVTGVAIAPNQLHYYYACGTGSEKPAIWRLDAITGVSTKVVPTSGAVPQTLISSRFNDFYTIEGVSVVRYQVGKTLPGTIEGSVTLADQPDDIAYDDATDRVIIFSPSPGLGQPRRVRAWGRTLPSFGAVLDLGSVPLTGQGIIAPDPKDSEAFWVAADGSSTVYRVKKSAVTGDLEITDTIANPGATIGGLNVTDSNTIVYTTNEVLVEKMKNGSGVWVNKSGSRWAGRLSSAKVHLSTSRSNFEDDVIVAPGTENLVNPIDYPSFRDACYADCDEDGVLSINDFICFQTTFAIGSILADCDLDGQLSIDDFICFQTLFAIGC